MAAQRRSPEEVAKSMEAAKKIKAQQVLKEQKSRIKWAKYALLFYWNSSISSYGSWLLCFEMVCNGLRH
jgi:hypothetical protein